MERRRKPKPKGPLPLTPKEIKLIQGIKEGKTKQKAGQDAGYGKTPGSTAAIVSETLKKPKVAEALAKALMSKNITIDRAVAPIDDALKDNDLEMRLKGSDRALKLLIGNQNNPGLSLHYHQHVTEQRDKYGI